VVSAAAAEPHHRSKRPCRKRSGPPPTAATSTRSQSMTHAQLTKLAAAVRLGRDADQGGPRGARGRNRHRAIRRSLVPAGFFATTPLSTWKEWLAFVFVRDHTPACFRNVDPMNCAASLFYSKQLSGVQRSVSAGSTGGQDGSMARFGEGVAKSTVRSHFPPMSEARQMTELIANLETHIASGSPATAGWRHARAQRVRYENRRVRAAHRPPGQI